MPLQRLQNRGSITAYNAVFQMIACFFRMEDDEFERTLFATTRRHSRDQGYDPGRLARERLELDRTRLASQDLVGPIRARLSQLGSARTVRAS